MQTREPARNAKVSPHIGRPPWSKLRAQLGALAASAGAVTAGAPGAPPRGRPAGRPPARDPEHLGQRGPRGPPGSSRCPGGRRHETALRRRERGWDDDAGITSVSALASQAEPPHPLRAGAAPAPLARTPRGCARSPARVRPAGARRRAEGAVGRGTLGNVVFELLLGESARGHELLPCSASLEHCPSITRIFYLFLISFAACSVYKMCTKQLVSAN